MTGIDVVLAVLFVAMAYLVYDKMQNKKAVKKGSGKTSGRKPKPGEKGGGSC